MEQKMINSIINTELDDCHILDASFNENTNEVSLKVAFFDNEMTFDMQDRYLKRPTHTKNYELAPDGDVVVHEIRYRDSYGIDYLLDGRKDDLGYERFKQLLFTRSIYQDLNNEPENAIFNSVIRYLEGNQSRNAKIYREAITSSKTKIWLDVLKLLGNEIFEPEFEKVAITKLDEYMARFLREHPEHLDRLATIATSAENILNTNSSISTKPNASSEAAEFGK